MLYYNPTKYMPTFWLIDINMLIWRACVDSAKGVISVMSVMEVGFGAYGFIRIYF